MKEIKKKEINLYFLDTDFSFTIQNIFLNFFPVLKNIPLEGSVSQNFDLGLSFYLRL